jgi:orotate phosphoribosyltransferase-like protein
MVSGIRIDQSMVEKIWELRSQGVSKHGISKDLGVSVTTARKYVSIFDARRSK